MTHRLASSVGLSAFLTLTLAPAQVAWEQVPRLTGRDDVAMAFDSLRGVAVAFGGREAYTNVLLGATLLWNGAGWTAIAPPHAPSPRTGHAMAFDAVHGNVVLFGGSGAGSPDAETWLFDGADWTLVHPATSPRAQRGHAMVWDAGRSVVLLHGSGAQLVDETWQWDGTTWTQLAPATMPPHRTDAALAYDAARDVVVLFGGSCYNPYSWCALADTWEWNGADWTQRNPAHRPEARWRHSLTYDPVRARSVMFGGGTEPYHVSSDTWEWDGVDWVERRPPLGPMGRESHGAAWDGSRVLLFAGREWGGMLDAHSDTWAWDGTAWTEVAAPDHPPWRTRADMAWDATSGRIILFSGEPRYLPNDTWGFDGTRWARLAPTAEPSTRQEYALSADPTTGGVLLFGGYRGWGTTLYDETWLWTGATWTLLSPAAAPPARMEHAMVTDTQRQRIVLFGGRDFARTFDDTWVFDGASWRELTTPTRPPGRSGHAMAYDRARDRIVLFGGWAGGTQFADTWEFDGGSWTERHPTTAPPAGSQRRPAAYDEERGRVVLHVTSAGVTWEWDGADWTARTTAPGPVGYDQTLASWDPHRGRTVLYTPIAGTWTYGGSPRSGALPFGAGCAGSAGVPVLATATGYGPVRGHSFTLRATSLPSFPIAFLELGLSRTSWNGLTLPIDLTPIGMPGCWALVSGEDFVTFAVQAGEGTWTIAVPDDPALLGAKLFTQVLAVDPAANLFGAIVSNALELGIGGS